MSFVAKLQRAREVLEQQGRLSVRALGRELGIGGDELDELIEELIEVQGVAVREGNILACAPPTDEPPAPDIPKHLAEKILASRAALEGERKQVTVLFADVKGSMELAEQLDPEEWSRIMQQFFHILSDGVERFEGFVDKFTGDGIMALFGAPIAHEDHAQRACYAALHLRDELRRFSQELRRQRGLDVATRIGIHSGDVVVGKIGDDLRMDYTAQGHTVGLAQRMEALAEAGKIYLTAATAQRIEGYFALEDLGEFNVKGASTPVHAYALEGLGHLRTRFDRSRARGLSRFVGRVDEMSVLESALARADQGEGQVIAVVAPAGTGKSRLCFELVEGCRAKGITVLEAQALAHGRSIPLRPMLEMFRQRFGISERDSALAAREKIAGALLLLDPAFAEILPAMFEFMGVADPARPAPKIDPESAQRRMLQYFRRVVQADTRERTVVTLIEDLHWLDDASDRFVAALVESAPTTRALLVLNFRPEYAAEWLKRSGVRQIALPPLGPEEVREVLAGLIGNDPSVHGLAELIHSRTGGNPFFAEEIVQALIEDGSLAGTVGGYRLTRPIEKIPLPETVQTVLAARIDRLEPHAKYVLQTAAVIGRELPRALLAALCEVTDAELEEGLATLRRSEFLFETALYPHVEYAFKHPLTHEVAYQSQLATRRAAVHRAAAQAMQTLYAEQLDERAAEIAWHWEAAGDRPTAAHWHTRAANWVEQRDVREAMRHWRAAYELLPEVPEDRTEAGRLIEVCQYLLLLGGWALGQTEQESRALLERGTRAADHHGDLGAQVRLRVAYANTRITRGRIADHLALARENAQLAAQSGDEALRALTYFEVGTAEGFAGNLDECERALDEFLRRTPGSVGIDAAIGRAVAHVWRADMLQYRGRSEEGAVDILRAREMAASADPLTQMLVGCNVLIFAEGRGECPDAMEVAARLMKAAEEFGAPNLRALARAALARAHALRSEWQEATRLFEEASAIGNQHGVYLECEGRDLASLAHAYVELGQPQRAREVAQRAVILAQERGSTIQELENVVALARAEVAVGHDDAVDPLLARAETLIGVIGAVRFHPHLAEIRAERACRRGDQATWRAELNAARHLFTEMGASGHAERVSRQLAAVSPQAKEP
jgi:class 3 adenylate cyclase/tetratricopeptide (TPR) repeat protein/DNA-binding IscR family transcriptional regulator